MNVYEKLMKIQTELKANKGQYNSFGKYHYRSCEDILEALKPLLVKYKATIVISDAIKEIGGRHYVESTVCFVDVEKSESVLRNTGYAREEENKKGMDSMQLTGATSSYARKYALNGMFAIDDTKDSDATNTHGKDNAKVARKVTKAQVEAMQELAEIKKADIPAMLEHYKVKSIEDMTPTVYAKALKALQAK